MNKNKLKKSNIFIHIPKTGGTTINTAMNNSYWQTKPDFHYRHIIRDTRESNAGDIFDPKNINKYLNYHLFMMMRDPIDRTASEYYFMREKKSFMHLISKKPTSFKNYIKSKHTQNGVINFLKGRTFFSTIPSTQKDLEDIIECIQNTPIKTGIFEHFEDSMNYFSKDSNLTWKKKIEVKRITFIRPKKEEIDEEVKGLILENNKLDVKLYEYCYTSFKKEQGIYLSSKVKFIKDKYNHVIPYANNYCFFEFCLENKKFISVHESLFKPLTFYIINDLKIKDVKTFVELWNISFINAMKDYFNDGTLTKELMKIEVSTIDPFQLTVKYSECIDSFFEKEKLHFHQYYKAMGFKKGYVPVLKSDISSRLFGLFGK
jgi:hypothetical protein